MTAVKRCEAFLQNIAKPTTDKADHVHWVDAMCVDANQGENLCHGCCQQRVDALNAKNPEGEYIVSGGHLYTGSDCSGVCEACGLALHVGLSEHGIASELEYFAGKRLDLRGPGASSEAFYLLAVLASARENEVPISALVGRIDAIRKRMAASNPEPVLA